MICTIAVPSKHSGISIAQRRVDIIQSQYIENLLLCLRVVHFGVVTSSSERASVIDKGTEP